MTWLLLLGCGEPVPIVDPVGCEPSADEIWWVEGQRSYDSLAEALDQAAPWHTLCLGEGRFELDEGLLELSLEGRIHLLGQGPELTELYYDPLDSGELSSTLALTGTPQQLVVEALSISTPIELRAQELVLRRVWMQGVQSEGALLRLDAVELSMDQVRVQDCRFAFGGLLIGDRPKATPAEIRGLEWIDNVATLGLHIFGEGERALVLEELLISGAADGGLNSGYAMIYAYAPVAIQSSLIQDARANGPLISARQLSLSQVQVLDSRGITGGLLQASESLRAVDLSVQGSRVTDSLFYLYQGGPWPLEVQLESLSLGTETENRAPCSMMVAGQCLESDWGQVDSWECQDCGG